MRAITRLASPLDYAARHILIDFVVQLLRVFPITCSFPTLLKSMSAFASCTCVMDLASSP
jgi:hypothetical protein